MEILIRFGPQILLLYDRLRGSGSCGGDVSSLRQAKFNLIDHMRRSRAMRFDPGVDDCVSGDAVYPNSINDAGTSLVNVGR